LRRLRLGDHRIQTIAEHAGVRYIDDSKATNPHAAAASLAAFDSVVWLAGGQAKGTSFDELVTAVAGKLRAAGGVRHRSGSCRRARLGDTHPKFR